MWLSASAGVAVIVTGLLLFGSITSMRPGQEWNTLLAHYNTTETVYRMEHGFENAVRESITPGLSEPEQVTRTCESVWTWASGEKVRVRVFFGLETFGFRENIVNRLSDEGRRLLRVTLETCPWACAAVLRRDTRGCIVIRNDGLVSGRGMVAVGIILEKEGVRTVIPEGRVFCGG